MRKNEKKKGKEKNELKHKNNTFSRFGRGARGVHDGDGLWEHELIPAVRVHVHARKEAVLFRYPYFCPHEHEGWRQKQRGEIIKLEKKYIYIYIYSFPESS